MSSQDDTAKLWDMMDKIRVAMLTTEHGSMLESRPMSAYTDREARLIWFITRIDTDKTHEIAGGAPVNLAFGDKGSNSFVSVSGTAEVVRDTAKQKALWNPFAEAWLPEGPEAPTTGLIKVTPVHGTLWDAPGKLAQLFNVAKANITQTPASIGDVAHVDIR
jgi:general stress protein 26